MKQFLSLNIHYLPTGYQYFVKNSVKYLLYIRTFPVYQSYRPYYLKYHIVNQICFIKIKYCIVSIKSTMKYKDYIKSFITYKTEINTYSVKISTYITSNTINH